MFGNIKNAFRKIFKAGYVDEKLLEEVIKEIQRALITSDVDVKLVFELSARIKKRIKDERETKFTKKELIVKVIYEELVNLLGKKGEIKIGKKPFKILLVGLFGAGKTTAAAKLAHFYKKKGYKVCLLGLDIFRPAAGDQIMQLGKKIDVDVFFDKNYKKTLKTDIKKYDIVIADSAGRDALDKALVKEIKEIKKLFGPNDIELVISGDIGQSAKVQANEFHKNVGVNGVIVTKLDGTAKGGGALTACAISKANVTFIGVGEGVKDLEIFEPERFISRITGLGDLQSLLEKAQEIMDEQEAEKTAKRMMAGQGNLLDLYYQLDTIGKMGNISSIANMVPGLSMANLPKDKLEVQEKNLKKFRNIMDSMTKEELNDPKLLNKVRIERIAKGSGATEKQVRELIKQYNMMNKMMKGMGGRKKKKLMKRFGLG